MMLTCQEPFVEATESDKHYLRFQLDAPRYMEGRKISIPSEALDLIMGMLKQDPNERLTMD
jgi:hypothetical protein